MRLFSYKMTHDTGFAPNPFWGYLTLATCKPGIRQSKGPGDWVAGFTSKTLCKDRVGEERLVFLMLVDESVPFADYFTDPRFQSKKPVGRPAPGVYKCGDNIYRPHPPNAHGLVEFDQLPNCCHRASEKERDLKGRNALIATCFVYFGRMALAVPTEILPKVPLGPTFHGIQTRDTAIAKDFIDYALSDADNRVMAPPHCWPRDDSSWKAHEADASQQELSHTEDYSTARSTCGSSDHGVAPVLQDPVRDPAGTDPALVSWQHARQTRRQGAGSLSQERASDSALPRFGRADGSKSASRPATHVSGSGYR